MWCGGSESQIDGCSLNPPKHQANIWINNLSVHHARYWNLVILCSSIPLLLYGWKLCLVLSMWLNSFVPCIQEMSERSLNMWLCEWNSLKISYLCSWTSSVNWFKLQCFCLLVNFFTCDEYIFRISFFWCSSTMPQAMNIKQSLYWSLWHLNGNGS